MIGSKWETGRGRAAAGLCAAGLAAVCLAGCGGGGSQAAKSSSPPLTKAQYVAKLNQIEGSMTKSFGALPSNATGLSTGGVAKAQRGLRAMADRLAALNPPDDVESLQAEFVSALRDFADALPDLTRKLQQKAKTDPAGAASVLLGAKPMQRLISVSNAFAKKGYGTGSQ